MEDIKMLRVKIGENDIRRVNPRDKDRFMAAYPGAEILDEAPVEDTEGKMMAGPPANKSQAKAESK